MLTIEEDYYQWLLQQIKTTPDIPYSKLLGKLYTTKYGVKRDVDEPRVRKAAELRIAYGIERFMNYPQTADIPEVSVLEVLVSLAVDVERTVMKDGDAGDRTDLWFWSMIHNLGLNLYTDDKYDVEAVDDILSRFVNHKYQRNGMGSIAYTTRSRGDFRQLDIWHQLNIWLTENYVYAGKGIK